MSKKSKSSDDISAIATRLKLERLARLVRSSSFAGGLHPAQWEALRFLAHANTYSNSPGALAKYLGTTKGTVSQTVMILEKKGLIEKVARGSDSRSVILKVTDAGQAVLDNDPLLHLEKAIATLGDKTRKRFAKGVEDILDAESLRLKEPSFGDCESCRYFRTNISGGDLCMKFEVKVSEAERRLICVEHLVAN